MEKKHKKYPSYAMQWTEQKLLQLLIRISNSRNILKVMFGINEFQNKRVTDKCIEF